MPEAGVESAMPFRDAGAGVTGAAKPAHAATMGGGATIMASASASTLASKP